MSKSLTNADLYDCSKNVLDIFKPFLKMPREITSSRTIWYGVELECQIKDNSIYAPQGEEIVMETKRLFDNLAILKEDGSVDNGFEIVTVPATLNFHRNKMWKEFYDTKHYRNLTAWSTKCCGLHVHFSIAGMSEQKLAKFLYFMHEPHNSKLLEYMAGRPVSSTSMWNNQSKKTLSENKINKDTSKEVIEQAKQFSRNAAGISNNTDGKTVEVRIFRGNVKPGGVIRALETVDALLLFSKYATLEKLNPQHFISWFDLCKISIKYPVLASHLAKARRKDLYV